MIVKRGKGTLVVKDIFISCINLHIYPDPNPTQDPTITEDPSFDVNSSLL